jgi:hypothetical protein
MGGCRAKNKQHQQMQNFIYYTCFGASAILKELTPMLLKRTALKWFKIIVNNKCVGFT